ncbi:hypothetical protein B0H10DRAFT_1268193 [Mycena sp. CBHHK59/15]|nr:hypothetical protein B0H10DRAFT_1268193 [Mycena sp. CBHHK59/15]
MVFLCSASIAMTLNPSHSSAVPLLSPTSSRRDSSTNIPAIDWSNATDMNTQAQQFLNGLDLRLAPIIKAEEGELILSVASHHTISAPSSTRSSRNQSPRYRFPVLRTAYKHHHSEEEPTTDFRTVRPEMEDEDMVMPEFPDLESPISGLMRSTIVGKIKVEETDPPLIIPPEVQRASHERDLPIIHQLSKVLLDIRKEVASGLLKERAIFQALKKLGAPDIVECQSDSSPQNDFISKVGLELLQNELTTERQKREEAEESIKEIARECREPFVVPALMDAFITISKLTTHVLEATFSNDSQVTVGPTETGPI